MSARRKDVTHTPMDLGAMADELMAAQPHGGFTRGQIMAAVSRCRALCPGIEIYDLHPITCGNSCHREGQWDITEVSGIVPSDQAHILMDIASVPKLPKRLNANPSAPFLRVERRAGGYICFDAVVRDDAQIAALIHLSPSAIRSAVPEAPGSERIWRDAVVEKLDMIMRFCDPEMLRTALCRPVRPSSMPSAWHAREAAYVAANARYYLRQDDLEHLVALYARKHAEIRRELRAAFDKVRACGPGTTAGMRLVADNAGPEPIR